MRQAFVVTGLVLLVGCGGGSSPYVSTPLGPASMRHVARTAQEVLLVTNDSSPASVAIGKEYVRLRHVTNVVHVTCIDSAVSQDDETIPYADFAVEIESPIRTYLQKHPEINYVVTTKGIPIRVSGAKTGEGSSGVTNASLDSTIAAIGYDRLPGAVKVRFRDPKGYAVGTAWLNRYWRQTARFSHAAFGGYLVTRLDGYTLQDALALTHRALAAEAQLSNGSIVLDIEPDFGLGDALAEPAPIPSPLITAEDPYDTWNADMRHAAIDLRARHIAVDEAITHTFVGHRTNLLGYFSWGSNDDHFKQAAYRTLRFAPGAVGDTAVSTSARSFFPQTSGQSMIADLIRQGITGVKGYTDEPLLQGISSPTIVLGRFTGGYTLAESFYAGSHFVGWTDLVVGDPLAQPY
jgi:uncharacterized protein (TIGR03790 family)